MKTFIKILKYFRDDIKGLFGKEEWAIEKICGIGMNFIIGFVLIGIFVLVSLLVFALGFVTFLIFPSFKFGNMWTESIFFCGVIELLIVLSIIWPLKNWIVLNYNIVKEERGEGK